MLLFILGMSHFVVMLLIQMLRNLTVVNEMYHWFKMV